MALNAELLGAALNTAANDYNDKDIDNLPEARANYWKAIASEIVKHFKENGEITTAVETTGTATAQTGTGTGTIS